MARGKENRGRGNRGQRGGGGPPRGGRGRGSNYRGRGRGNGPSGFSSLDGGFDLTIHTYADIQPGQGNAEPRTPYRGRGFRGYSPHSSHPNSGANTPSRGRDSPRGRGGRGRGDFGIGSMRGGRGAGRGGSKLRHDAPLSGLLYQERPFLRPVVFVPSVYTRTLFQEEEDILKPGVEDVGDGFLNHAPTADQVARVFSSGNIPRMETSASEGEGEDGDEDELEEIDFNDMAKLLETPIAESQADTTANKAVIVEEQFTGFFVDTQSSIREFSAPSDGLEQPGDIHPMEVVDFENLDVLVNDTTPTSETPAQSIDRTRQPEIAVVEEKFSGFYIDAGPTPLPESGPLDDTRTIPISSSTPSTPTGAHGLANETPVAPVASSVTSYTTVESTPADEPELAPPSFYIDTDPTPVPTSEALIPTSPGDQEEIIVYVAPHPRTTSRQHQPDGKSATFSPYVRAGPLPSTISMPGPATTPQIPAIPSTSAPKVSTPPPFSSISFSFTSNPAPSPAIRKRNPVPTPRAAKAAKARERKRAKRSKQAVRGTFGAYGAMMEEAVLRGSREDKRRTERRRGDSDLDWGTDESDDGDGDVEEESVAEILGLRTGGNGKGKERATVSYEAEGMEVDPELQLDVEAMKRFVGGLTGKNAGKFMTMDDIRDGEIMQMEDEEEDGGPARGSSDEEDEEDEDGSSDEDGDDVEVVLDVEERMLIAEDGVDSEEDDSDSEDHTPRTSFRARLEHLRKKSQGKRAADASFGNEVEDSSDDDDFFSRNMTWAEQDDDFIRKIQDMLDENEDVLTGRDRKERNKFFRAVRNGNFDDMEGVSPAKRRKDKGKGLPPALQAQWDKDREKKAEFKRARELARLEQAADSLAKKKGGKKGRKAMMAASKLDPTITVIPNRIIDMVTLVQQIRRFLADVDGPSSMSLPPTNKETRKNIHEMALAFKLKSLSKGNGDARYTTLQKKTKSGLIIDEAKVARIVRKSGGGGSRGGQFVYNERKGGQVVMPRHKEGEEVGKAAPKIGESNLGFRMLASMGWSEGDRIGATGGLEVPLTAIIKNTKLGLGATR